MNDGIVVESSRVGTDPGFETGFVSYSRQAVVQSPPRVSAAQIDPHQCTQTDWLGREIKSAMTVFGCAGPQSVRPVRERGTAVSDTGELLTPTRAVTRRSRHVPVIWAIPLLAIAIGGWLAWDTLSKRGPTITISFVSAEGLQAGQSQLKFKDIVLGPVQSLTLTPDHTRFWSRSQRPDRPSHCSPSRPYSGSSSRGCSRAMYRASIRWFLAPMSACCRPRPGGSNSSSSRGAKIRRSSKPMSRERPSY